MSERISEYMCHIVPDDMSDTMSKYFIWAGISRIKANSFFCYLFHIGYNVQNLNQVSWRSCLILAILESTKGVFA